LGGSYYCAVILIFLGLAAWEYGQVFQVAGYKASGPILLGGVFIVIISRCFFPVFAPGLFSLILLISMAWHLWTYERGRETAAADFAITASGVAYLGWIGAYLVDLRNMPQGLFWLALVLPSVWLADSAAYFFGKRFGKHRLSPRLSPKKSWEGYFSGVVIGTIGASLLAVLWHRVGNLDSNWWQGAILGFIISVLTTLGDLGESMIKRQAGLKDSGNLIPGHGGFLDRVDSWLWAGVIGYLVITWFFI
jgi:phosphatidate cytidylyltransferase